MRKSIIALATALVLPLSSQAQDVGFDEAQLYQKAKEEGELTWYVGQYGTELAEQVAASFTEAYPGVRVNVIRAGGQVLYARLMQDMQAGVAQCDVFGATETGHLEAMKEADQLQPFSTANDADLHPSLRNADPDGYFVHTQNSDVVLIYNTNLVTEAEAPKSWRDLTDPKWTGKVSLPHPGFSGSASTWAALMTTLYGSEYLEDLEKIEPHIGRSMGDPAVTLAAGERAVGITVLSWALNAIRSGDPIGYVIPEEGVMRNNNATGIPTNAPHPNAARLFVNYLQSPEASRIVAEEFGYTPVNAKAPRPSDMPALEDIKAVEVSENELSARVGMIVEEWRDVFGG